jgi:hypothetical protein
MNQIGPAIGIAPTNIHHPLRLVSCILRAATAMTGSVEPSPNNPDSRPYPLSRSRVPINASIIPRLYSLNRQAWEEWDIYETSGFQNVSDIGERMNLFLKQCGSRNGRTNTNYSYQLS